MATPKKLSLQRRLALPLSGRNLRLDEVSARVGLAQSTVDKLVIDGLFPAPLRIGTSKVWPVQSLLRAGLLSVTGHDGGGVNEPQ